MAGNYKRKRKKIVFFGDSITNQGTRPGGFIKHLLQLLKEADIEYNYELAGAGADGDTVTDLHNRVDKDILSEGADVVVVLIGINDVWHKETGGGTGIREFEAAYEAIIEKLDAAVIKTVLCTLTLIGEKINYLNEHDPDLEMYSQLIRNLAIKYKLPLVELREAFLDYNFNNNIENKEYGILTQDKVHLSKKGNELVAKEMWKVLQQLK